VLSNGRGGDPPAPVPPSRYADGMGVPARRLPRDFRCPTRARSRRPPLRLGFEVSPSVTQLAGLPVLLLEGAAADAGLDEAATGETPCLTFTTSGTTGGPKLVLHDHQAIAGHAIDVA